MAKRYLVPQYIEMADKIVGPLTLAQFLYVLAGSVLCYFFFTFFNKLLAWPLSIIVGSFFLAMAFLKINDLPFPRILYAGIIYFLRPKERVWKKTERLPEIKIKDKHLTKSSRPEKESKTKTREKIESQLAKLAAMVDSSGWGEKTGKEFGPGEEAFKARVKSHTEIRPEHLPEELTKESQIKL